MRLLLTLGILSMLLAPAQAQFGINGAYARANAGDWEQLVAAEWGDGPSFYQNGWKAGVDYWFRLKKVRLEFLPEVGYGRWEAQKEAETFETSTIYFQLNANLYPFNFLDDCDCPTFSKQDPFLKKSFFLQLSPSVQRMTHRYAPVNNEIYEVADWAYGLGLGAGVDLGVSDLLTLTPFVRYSVLWQVEWEEFRALPLFEQQTPEPSPDVPTDWSQLEVGLRLGVRLNE